MARCCFHFLSLYICACFYLKIQYMFLKRAFLKLERHVFWTYSNTQQTYFRKKKHTLNTLPDDQYSNQVSQCGWGGQILPTWSQMLVFFIYSNIVIWIYLKYTKKSKNDCTFFSFRLWPSRNTCIYTLLYMLERLTSVNFTFFSVPEKKPGSILYYFLGLVSFLMSNH